MPDTLDGNNLSMVASTPEPDADFEEVYALFSVPGRSPAYTQPGWVEAVRNQRATFGQLFFDRVLSFVVQVEPDQVAELYPPTSVAGLHALIDLVASSIQFSKARVDAVLFYLLLALFPTSTLSSSSATDGGMGKAFLAAARSQRTSSAAHKFAQDVSLPPPLRRVMTAYALLDQGQFDHAVSHMHPEEVEFAGDMLAIIRDLSDDYRPPSILTLDSIPLRMYAPGEYRSRVLLSLVETLSFDLPNAWIETVQVVQRQPDDVAVMKDAHANLVAHAKALSLTPGRGPATAWQAMVERVPELKAILEEELLEGTDTQEDTEASDHVLVRAIDELHLDLVRAVWESAFSPTVRPHAAQELLSMPISRETIAVLRDAVLTPSSDLTEVARAASSEILLARTVADADYVGALRLEAKLGGSEGHLAVPAAQRATLAARRRDLIRGVHSILPAIQRSVVDVELGSTQTQQQQQNGGTRDLAMSWDKVDGEGVTTESQQAAEGEAPPKALSTSLMTTGANADPQGSLFEAVRAPAARRSSQASRRSSAVGGLGDTSSNSFIPGYLSRAQIEPTTTISGDVSSISASFSRKLKPRSSTHEAFVDPPNLSYPSSRGGDRSLSIHEPLADPVPMVVEDQDQSVAWGQGLPTNPLPSLTPPPQPAPEQPVVRSQVTVTAEEPAARAPKRSEPKSKLPAETNTRRTRAPKKTVPQLPVRDEDQPTSGSSEGKKELAQPRRFARAARTRKAPSAPTSDRTERTSEPAPAPMTVPAEPQDSHHRTVPGTFPGMDEDEESVAVGVSHQHPEVDMHQFPPRRTSPRRRRVRGPDADQPQTIVDQTPARRQASRRARR